VLCGLSPKLATGKRRAVSSAWKRYGTFGRIGAANKGFIGDDAAVSYLNNKGDNHEIYSNGTGYCVRALQQLRICPQRSSQLEDQDPSLV